MRAICVFSIQAFLLFCSPLGVSGLCLWVVSVGCVCDVRRGCIGGVIVDGLLCACCMGGLLLSCLFEYL